MPLYPLVQPVETGYLQVSDTHSLYWEDVGARSGTPVVYVHGGPGGGIDPQDRRYFDPEAYRVILFDQRGAGKSLPHASLHDNTTWALVDDMERLRESMGIERWVVFGGSWGSTLSLAYAQRHPTRCLGLILRGIFTLRRKELLWFYQSGAGFLFPEYFAAYLAPIPESERDDIMAAYYRRLTGDDEVEKLKCAAAWSKWETLTSTLVIDPKFVEKSENAAWALAFARIECHFFVNAGWMEEGQLLDNVDVIRHLPIAIVQGRYDVVCPATTAWELYRALGGDENENVTLQIIPDCGHSAREKGTTEALVAAADKFRGIEKK